MNKIKPLKIDKKSKVRFLSRDEEGALRQALDDREADIRKERMSGNTWREVRRYNTLPAIDAIFADYLKPLVLLALNTGLRRGGASNPRWPDIDFQRTQLSVEGTTAKSGQTRHIPLSTEVQAILKSWREQPDTEYISASPVTRERFDNIKR